MTHLYTADITAALRAADIDYRMQHGRTLNESILVTRADGTTVAFAPSVTDTGRAAEGIDVAYYIDVLDSDVRTQDYVLTVDALVADLLRFLGRSDTIRSIKKDDSPDIRLTRKE